MMMMMISHYGSLYGGLSSILGHSVVKIPQTLPTGEVIAFLPLLVVLVN